MIFFTKLVKTEILTLYATTFEPIKIQKRSAPQNDRLNISFVKDAYVNAKKMGRKVGKLVIYELQILGLTLYILITLGDHPSCHNL